MISTGTLMLGKALLTAGAILGFCVWQLLALRRLRRQREAARTVPIDRPAPPSSGPDAQPAPPGSTAPPAGDARP